MKHLEKVGTPFPRQSKEYLFNCAPEIVCSCDEHEACCCHYTPAVQAAL